MEDPKHGGPGAEKADTYESYLQLHKILDGVRRLSEVNGDPAHEEHLFIIVHQAFELWFKQVLFDLDTVIETFNKLANGSREEKDLGVIVTRLQRTKMIFKLVVQHFEIMETMAPLLFLEFRCHLGDASGFQSEQFRMIEIKFGLADKFRKEYGNCKYIESMKNEDTIERLKKATKDDKTLLSSVENWLKSVAEKKHSWWEDYKASVKEKDQETFGKVTKEEVYNADLTKRKRRLSHKAFIGALMISTNRDEPGYALPCQIISLLTDIDNLIMEWRHRHVQMVHRMIGSKGGTGGSSGYLYLRSTVSEDYRVFVDFSNLATYLIPRTELIQKKSS